jgi:hypothetical protein
MLARAFPDQNSDPRVAEGLNSGPEKSQGSNDPAKDRVVQRNGEEQVAAEIGKELVQGLRRSSTHRRGLGHNRRWIGLSGPDRCRHRMFGVETPIPAG